MATLCPSCGVRNIEGTDECAHCGADLTAIDQPRAVTSVQYAVMNGPVTVLNFSNPDTLSPDQSLAEAVNMMARNKQNIAPVIENGRLVGLLSVRDLINRVGADYSEKLPNPVRQYMTPRPSSLPPDATVAFVLHEMDVGGYRNLPIVKGESLQGIVSARDVMRYILHITQVQTAR